MITCSSCGKPIDKVPSWLQGTKADFVCNNCPNRQTKNIAFVTLDPVVPVVGTVDEEEPTDLDDLGDDADL
jgi:hypothetical protein